MKKSLYVILVSIFALALVACGENASATATPEKEEAETENTTEYREYDGEGEGQGVIKSDDELSALEEEAEQYSSGEDYDTYVIESKEEVAEEESSVYKANCPYVPASEFWVSDTEFDLIGWFEANGAQVVLFYDLSGTMIDGSDCDNVYYARALYCFDRNTIWSVCLSDFNASTVFEGGGTGNKLCDCTCEHGDYIVYTTGYSKLTMCPAVIEKMDFAMKAIKENPYSSDPISHAEGWNY